jgi:hypothetical protein
MIEYIELALKGLAALLSHRAEQKKKINNLHKEYFKNHIEPLYEKLKIVHNDYLQSFKELHEILSTDRHVSQDIYDRLNTYRIKYQIERIELIAAKEGFAHLQYEITSRHPPESDIERRTLRSILNFVENIFKYFPAANDLYELSWYTNFEQRIQELAKTQNRIPSDKEGYMADTLSYIHDALHTYLPDRFRAVVGSYNAIKNQCLS